MKNFAAAAICAGGEGFWWEWCKGHFFKGGMKIESKSTMLLFFFYCVILIPQFFSAVHVPLPGTGVHGHQRWDVADSAHVESK